MRVAIVHETLPLIGGAEKVLFALSELFPDAPVFTLLYNADAFRGSPLWVPGKSTLLSSRDYH